MHVYFISNRVYIYLNQHRHHSRLFKQCLNTFQIGWNTVGTPFRLVGMVFKHFSDWLERCSNTCQTGWNSVQTLFRLVQTLLEHFSDRLEQCLNTSQIGSNIVQTLFFGHVIHTFHVFEQCLNSPPCGGVLFEHCLNNLSLFGNVRTLRTVFKPHAHAHYPQ